MKTDQIENNSTIESKNLTAWKIIRGIFYTMIILILGLIVLSTIRFGRWSLFAVKSGSMEPKIHTGSVVFDQSANEYFLNDIITYHVSNSKDTVTHRIVSVISNKNGVEYQVKGDANDAPDSNYVNKTQIVGRVIFSIPFLGYVIVFSKTLPGLIVLIIIPATIIILSEFGAIKKEITKLRGKEKK